jgi:hypothetical protein
VVYFDLLLVGFGHVGRQFARLLLDRSVRLRGDFGTSWRVVGIATRHHGTAFDARGIDLVRALALAERGMPIGSLSQPDGGRTWSSSRPRCWTSSAANRRSIT